MTDEELAKKALKNNDYFAEIIERYEEKLFRYLKRLTGFEKQDIEDILQEVFIKIYRNLNNFDASLSFSSWAYRITHNEAVNQIKKHKRKYTYALESEEKDTVSLIKVLKSDDDVKDRVIKKEESRIIKKILYKIPKKYRDVLVLYYLEDMDYSEISDILKKPMGTVATLLSRAKKKLKEQIKK
jgi:RNA polymerase sigma-70 factor (ECF subfamily)